MDFVMPKLPVIRPKEIIRILERIGFVVDHVTGSHYIMYCKEKRQRAVVPHHVKDIPKVISKL